MAWSFGPAGQRVTVRNRIVKRLFPKVATQGSTGRSTPRTGRRWSTWVSYMDLSRHGCGTSAVAGICGGR